VPYASVGLYGLFLGHLPVNRPAVFVKFFAIPFFAFILFFNIFNSSVSGPHKMDGFSAGSRINALLGDNLDGYHYLLEGCDFEELSVKIAALHFSYALSFDEQDFSLTDDEFEDFLYSKDIKYIAVISASSKEVLDTLYFVSKEGEYGSWSIYDVDLEKIKK